jgi:hypothetical protein
VEVLAPSRRPPCVLIAPNAVLIAERRLLDGAHEDIIDWMGKTMVGGSVGEIRGAAATKQGNSRHCFDQRGRHRGDHGLGRRRGDQRLGSAPGRPQGSGGAGEQIWGSGNEKIGRGGTCMKLLNLHGQLMEGHEQMRPRMGGNKYVLSVPRP